MEDINKPVMPSEGRSSSLGITDSVQVACIATKMYNIQGNRLVTEMMCFGHRDA